MLSKLDAKGTTSYTYDKLNRLLTVIEPSGKVTSYTFDASGNRSTETVTVGSDTIVTTYTYDGQNRLTGTLTTANGQMARAVTYTYDNNGNQLITTRTEYTGGVAQTPVTTATNTYDELNRLISTITEDGTAIVNTYNGDGLRIGKIVNGVLTKYLYEGSRVVLELDAQGNQTAWNMYGTNLISRLVGVQLLTYMYNGHADVTALLDTNGNLVATYYYDAFGNILEKTGTAENSILYGGYQYDEETGLYYLNARMYDPVTARFLQEDTYRGQYKDPLSLNLYTYCHNEPLRFYDPTGYREVIGGDDILGVPQAMMKETEKKRQAAVEKRVQTEDKKLEPAGILSDIGKFVENLSSSAGAVVHDWADYLGDMYASHAGTGLQGKDNLIANIKAWAIKREIKLKGDEIRTEINRFGKTYDMFAQYGQRMWNSNIFDSPEEAAAAFGRVAGVKTEGDKREHMAGIYSVGFGDNRVYFNGPIRTGGHDNVVFNYIYTTVAGIMPEISTAGLFRYEGYSHTHPYCNGHDGLNYSKPDEITSVLTDYCFLVAPNGILYRMTRADVLDPAGISITSFGKVFPASKYTDDQQNHSYANQYKCK
jgi:RHS repeat-associated protein